MSMALGLTGDRRCIAGDGLMAGRVERLLERQNWKEVITRGNLSLKRLAMSKE
jgi:hypothetical protein